LAPGNKLETAWLTSFERKVTIRQGKGLIRERKEPAMKKTPLVLLVCVSFSGPAFSRIYNCKDTKTAISSSQRHRRVAVENPAGTRDSLPQTARIREHRIPGSGDPNNDIKVLIYVGAIRSGSHPVHDFMNAATHSFQIRRAPWTGAGSLAGDERKRTPGVLQ